MTPEDRRQMLVAEIEDLSAVLMEQGLTATGSRGQDIIHPALKERRAALAELRQLERTIRATAEPEGDALDEFLLGTESARMRHTAE